MSASKIDTVVVEIHEGLRPSIHRGAVAGRDASNYRDAVDTKITVDALERFAKQRGMTVRLEAFLLFARISRVPARPATAWPEMRSSSLFAMRSSASGAACAAASCARAFVMRGDVCWSTLLR